MGNLKPIDSALVKDVDYDLISPDTVGGEYIETIGAACENPDGYTSGSLFLGKENGVQHLYRATAAIAFGETIILDTNCTYTTVSSELEGKAEKSEVTSLNEALANEVATRVANGAHNLFFDMNSSAVLSGITTTKNADGSWTFSAGTVESSFIQMPYGYTDVYKQVAKATLPNTTYKFSIGIEPRANVSLGVFYKANDSASWTTLVSDTINVSEITFTTPAEYTQLMTRFIVAQDSTIPTLTFKPLLRIASDADSTYTPYAMTNRELMTELITYDTFNFSVAFDSGTPNSYVGVKDVSINKNGYKPIAISLSTLASAGGIVIYSLQMEFNNSVARMAYGRAFDGRARTLNDVIYARVVYIKEFI